ncbi:hypothetical protein [Mycobacteroides franklinii]|uniref:Ryanodine receptor Ryr domain-containing protein n=1 Tax=Mycobacteroides franklinii TaxID=948102 RepID=A0A4R5PBA2_9MYCO|nr:hypothetical protein [Mycobacteroides franklinii]ORA61323.1 hypothetical protein BST24_11065 [Mycobacteroides franklinii]TDH22016.1 hypothetical protein EJ571_08630 [Mycobacteroides franklinii]
MHTHFVFQLHINSATVRENLSVHAPADDKLRRPFFLRTARRRRPVVARRWTSIVELLLDTCFVTAIIFLCLKALKPGIFEGISWFSWFGTPGSGALATIAAVLALPTLGFGVRWLSGTTLFDGPPLVLLSAAAASAFALGMSAYWGCHGAHAPFFAPLTWTVALFAGEYQDPDGAGSSCQTVPVALDFARLLAIGTTLGTALAAALTFLRAERDRLAVWRARALTAVVGLDDDAVPMVRAIARTMSPRESLVVLTGDSDTTAAHAVRDIGARVRVVNLDDPQALPRLHIWNRLDRLYLLSADPVQNLKRFNVINAEVGGQRSERVRLPVTVRIDNPWQAEVVRRRLLAHSDRRWAADAVGRFEATAAKLVRHMTLARPETDAPQTVVLCGLSPLTYAIASALSQSQRELELDPNDRIVLPARVVIFARGAQSFVDDHRMWQSMLTPANSALPVIAHNAEPSVDEITEYIRQDPPAHVVVFSDPAMETEGIRLTARFPDLRLYLASAVSTTFTDFSLAGSLLSFPINMELDQGAPHDAWERAAELIHEHYSRGKDRTRRATKPWVELDPFLKSSNRRQVLNALWIVETYGDHTWNSFESGPAEPLPPGFDALDPLRRLEILGFEEATVMRMIKAEHEDWYRFYRGAGWKYAAIRDDDHNSHDKLLPWSDMEKHPGFVLDAQRSLASTLINLRCLGYRPVLKRQVEVRSDDVG